MAISNITLAETIYFQTITSNEVSSLTTSSQNNTLPTASPLSLTFFEKGQQAYIKGDYREAISNFKSVKEPHLKDTIQYYLGLCYFSVNEYSSAWQCFLNCFFSNNIFSSQFEIKAFNYFLDLFKNNDNIVTHPEFKDALNNFFEKNDSRIAFQAIFQNHLKMQAASADFTHPDFINSSIGFFSNLKKLDKDCFALDYACDLFTFDMPKQLGEFYIQTVDKIFTIAPNDPDLRAELGHKYSFFCYIAGSFFSSSNSQEAKKWFCRGLEFSSFISPKTNFNICLKLAELLYAEGNLEEALSNFKIAFSLTNDHDRQDIVLKIGLIHLSLNNIYDAKAAFNLALNLDNVSPDVFCKCHLLLGEMCLLNNEIGAAFIHAQRAKSSYEQLLLSNSPEILHTYIRILLLTGEIGLLASTYNLELDKIILFFENVSKLCDTNPHYQVYKNKCHVCINILKERKASCADFPSDLERSLSNDSKNAANSPEFTFLKADLSEESSDELDDQKLFPEISFLE